MQALEPRCLLSVTAVFEAGTLFVTSDAADTIVIGHGDGFLSVSDGDGLVPIDGGANVGEPQVAEAILVPAAEVTSIVVVAEGEFANLIDLRAVTSDVFTSLAEVTVNAGGGDDTILVAGSAATTQIFGEGGDDQIILADHAESLDGLSGAFSVNGGAGSDTLTLRSTGSELGARKVGVTNAAVTGIGSPGGSVAYSDLGGDGATGELGIATNGAGHVFNVQSTAAGVVTTLDTGSGDDRVNVSSNAPANTGTLNQIKGRLDLNTGEGMDTLVVSAMGALAGDTYSLTRVGGSTELDWGDGFAGVELRYDANGVAGQLEHLNLVGSDRGGNTFNINHTTATLSTLVLDGVTDNANTSTAASRFNIAADKLQGGSRNLFHGLAGNDRFDLTFAANAVVSNAAGTTLEIAGGRQPGGTAHRDEVNIFVNAAGDGARHVALEFLSSSTGDVLVTGLGSPLGIVLQAIEQLSYTGNSANNDVVAVLGTSGRDIFHIRPLSASGADVFLNGTAGQPGFAGGGRGPDLHLGGLSALTVDGRAGRDDFNVDVAGRSGALLGLSLIGGAGVLDLFTFLATNADDTVIYLPSSDTSAELEVSGAVTMAIEVAALELVHLNGRGHTSGDALQVTAANMLNLPSGPGAGTLVITDSQGGALLSPTYENFESVSQTQTTDFTITGTNFDDLLTIINGIATLFPGTPGGGLGQPIVYNVAAFDSLIVNMLGGNDRVIVDSPGLFPGGISLDGGTNGAVGDAITVHAKSGKVVVDVASGQISKVIAGKIRLAEMEHVTVLGRDGVADETAIWNYGAGSVLRSITIDGGDTNNNDGDRLTVDMTPQADAVTVTPLSATATRIRRGVNDPVIETTRFNNGPQALQLTGFGGADSLTFDTSAVGTFLQLANISGGFAISPDSGGQAFTPVNARGFPALTIAGSSRSEHLNVNTANGLLSLSGGIAFHGGDGQNTLRFTGPIQAGAAYLLGVEPGEGSVSHTHSLNPALVQAVTFTGVNLVRDALAGPMTLTGSESDDVVVLGAGTVAGFVGVDVADHFAVEFANKLSFTFAGGDGDDEMTVDATGLPAVMPPLSFSGGGGGGGDAFILRGTEQDDLFDYTPTALDAATLLLTGGANLDIALAGVEAAHVDGRGQEVADALIVNADSLQIIPGEAAGSGLVQPFDALSQPLLPLSYEDIEAPPIVEEDSNVVEGTDGDDTLVIIDCIATLTTPDGVTVVDMSAFDNIVINLGGGNNVITIVGGDCFPGGVIFAGDGHNTLIVQAVTSPIVLDFEANTLIGITAGVIHLTGIAALRIDGVDGLDIDLSMLNYGAATDLQEVVYDAKDTAGDDEDRVHLTLTAGADTLHVSPTAFNATELRRAAGDPVIELRNLNRAAGVLDIDGLGGDDALVVNGLAGNDRFALSSIAGVVRLAHSVNGVAHLPLELAGFTALTVNGAAGNDELDVHLLDGPFGLLPGDIRFNGGAGSDFIRHHSSVQPQSITFDPQPDAQTQARLTHVFNGMTQVFHFNDVELLANEVPTDSFILNGTEADDVITWTDDGFQTAGVLLGIGSANLLTIRGHGGDDRIDLGGANTSAFATAIILDGGAGDDTLIGGAFNDTFLPGPGQNVLVGGGGQDHAIFAGSDADDNVAIALGSVLVNGELNLLTDILTVTVNTLGGDDAVNVDATTANFYFLLNINTGAGDDAIDVSFGVTGPNSTINIDGGPHVLGDSLAVRAVTVNDPLSVLANQVRFGAAVVNHVNVEHLDVFEGVRIAARGEQGIHPTRHQFLDADGNRVTVSIRGAGILDIYRRVPAINGPLGTAGADIDALVLSSTKDTATRIKVAVKNSRGTDNKTSIGAISGMGAKSIDVRKSDLVRGMALTGNLRDLRVADVLDGAAIAITGRPDAPMKLNAGNVGEVSFATTGAVGRANVNQWLGGTFDAFKIDRLTVREGDFRADIATANADAEEFSLKRLDVKNGRLISAITANRVKDIFVKGGNAEIDVLSTAPANLLPRGVAVERIRIRGGNLLGALLDLQPGAILKRLEVRASRGVGGNVAGPVTINGNVDDIRIGAADAPFAINGTLLGTLRTTTPVSLVDLQGGTNAIFSIDNLGPDAKVVSG